jgi:hypothetical protein
MPAYSAAICKRGHEVDDHVLDPARRLAGQIDQFGGGITDMHEVPAFCRWCGAPVILGCVQCGRPFPGFDGVIVVGSTPDPFCEHCGTPQPWATRQQRTGQLYNLIDFEENLDESARLQVVEAIAVLSEPDDDAEDERKVRAGEVVRRLAPRTWDTARPLLQSVLSEWLKRKLGLSLPPS